MPGLHLKAHYNRTRTAGAEDVAVTTHDFWFEGSDATDAQCDTLAATFVTFWTAIKSAIIADNVKLSELRFYKGYDGDGTPGEVDYVKTYTLPGMNSGMCPPQVACSVTEITDSRKHWGRFYIPGIAVLPLASDGTLTSASVTTIASAAEAMYESWGALASCTPIVWARTTHPISYNAMAPPRWRPSWLSPGSTESVQSEPRAMAVQAIRVDEILDIQRPRRWQSTQIRNTRQLA